MEELKTLLSAKLDDHDLLIEMRTLQRIMADKLETVTGDHERRIRSIEVRLNYIWGAMGIGGGAGIMTAIKIMSGKTPL